MDVDIDIQTDFNPKEVLNAKIASMVQDGKLLKHQAGCYLQNIPLDPITGLSAIPYKEAERLGYMKFDFLHLPSILDYFKSKKEIRHLINKEPDWSLLEHKSVVDKLFQLRNHFDIVNQIKPKSVQELADCVALIRPGKRNLLKAYRKNKENTRKVLYQEPIDGGYYYKKSHAVSYAFNIVLQLHLIKARIL